MDARSAQKLAGRPRDVTTAGSLPPESGGSGPVAELRNVTVRLGGRTVLRDVSGTVWPGEFVGVIGPNGAGKSTLLKVLLGLVRPVAGAVEFQSQPVRRGNARIGYCPQARAFDPDLPITGRDFVGLGLDGHRWGFRLPDRHRSAQIDRALAAVDAHAFADAPIGRLSGGQQQRLAIAQALLANPSLLLLDEPLASLDLRSQREIVELVDALRRERQVAVLFVTHGINPIGEVMDRVWYVAGGRAAIGTVPEVIRSDVLSELYGSPVDVVTVGGRIFVSASEECHGGEGHH